MFGNLLTIAKNEGVLAFELSLLLHKPDGFLLLENSPLTQSGFYEPPQGAIRENESINQAIDRIVMEKTNLKLESIEKLLCFFDTDEKEPKTRRFYFICKALDPEDIQLSAHHGYTWIKPEDAVGYPIKDELREAFDLYMKM